MLRWIEQVELIIMVFMKQQRFHRNLVKKSICVDLLLVTKENGFSVLFCGRMVMDVIT